MRIGVPENNGDGPPSIEWLTPSAPAPGNNTAFSESAAITEKADQIPARTVFPFSEPHFRFRHYLFLRLSTRFPFLFEKIGTLDLLIRHISRFDDRIHETKVGTARSLGKICCAPNQLGGLNDTLADFVAHCTGWVDKIQIRPILLHALPDLRAEKNRPQQLRGRRFRGAAINLSAPGNPFGSRTGCRSNPGSASAGSRAPAWPPRRSRWTSRPGPESAARFPRSRSSCTFGG